MTTTNLYDVLGIPRDAALPAIKKAYRKLARKFHPDSNPGDDAAAAKFRDIQDAYEVLSDPDRRAEYDKNGTTKAPRPGDAEIAEVVVPLLFEVLSSLGTESIKSTNVVGQIKSRVRSLTESAKISLSKWERGIGALKEVRSRITVPDDAPNFILDAVVREMANSEETIRRIKDDLDKFTRAIKYLDKCKYNVSTSTWHFESTNEVLAADALKLWGTGTTV